MTDFPILADLPLPTERDTIALGAALADLARKGDVLALHGPLGAGKTTLARGFITARAGVPEDVVSPTFTLVQVYDAPAAPIWHFDLYRLNGAGDVLELGWDDALSGGVSIVEWPERLGPLLPASRLDVMLSAEAGSDRRRAIIRGGALWANRIAGLSPGLSHG
jgi:tRNA threonylcarbamoyladenosine biosynthesis protein TsaE